ncbi:MAG: YoaK family protein [Acidobacteriaceae bacterium]
MPNTPVHPSPDPNKPYANTSPELKYAASLPVAVMLSMAGGCIDAFVYLNHGHVFAAVMTGNTVLLGAGLLKNNLSQSAHNAVPIVSFLTGLFCARLLQLTATRKYVTLGLIIETAGLFVASLLPASFPDMAFVALVSFLVAYQVASFRKEDGEKYNSTFVTADLRSAIDGLSDLLKPSRRPEGRKKAGELAIIFLSFLAGAIAAAFLSPRIFNHTLWFADLLLVLVIVVVLTKSRAAAFR